MKRFSKHLSYANVISTIALFLVLAGGAAFAASHLGKNSVGSKQLKKNAVTTAKIKKEAVNGAKVKKDSLTGTQINEAKLGTVPSAQLANTIPPAEATHFVGAPGEPAFENGATNFGVSGPLRLNNVGFYKDHEGIVHLEGIAKTGSATPLPYLFTLPPGYRPAPGSISLFPQLEPSHFLLVAGGSTVIEGVDLSGKVIGTGKEEAAILEGVTFRAGS
jgi:hypothetical protein